MASKKSTRARAGGKATKNPKQYRALKRKGMSKARAAKIANSGRKASVKGGKRSHQGSHHRGRK